MNYPYCQSCPRFEDAIQGCSDPGACPWEAWADGILYHPAKKTAGGTGVGFPALAQIGDSWQRGWLKAQEEGKTGGYDWPQTCKAFSYEVQALKYLEDLGTPFVPRVIVPDNEILNKEGKWVYYIMSRASGCDIDKAGGQDGKRPLFALCEALVALHRAGFGHYDLKPQNIKYDEKTERVTLIDFGSSKGPEDWRQKSERNRNHPVVEGNSPGTMPWVSPEQGKVGSRLINLKPLSDDYVYGLLFCKKVLGKIVKPGDSRKAIHIALRRAGIDNAIAETVAWRLLCPETAGRRGGLEALFAEMLRQGWNGKTPSLIRAQHLHLPPLPPEATEVSEQTVTAAPAGEKKKGKMLGAIVLAGLAFLGLFLWNNRNPRREVMRCAICGSQLVNGVCPAPHPKKCAICGSQLVNGVCPTPEKHQTNYPKNCTICGSPLVNGKCPMPHPKNCAICGSQLVNGECPTPEKHEESSVSCPTCGYRGLGRSGACPMARWHGNQYVFDALKAMNSASNALEQAKVDAGVDKVEDMRKTLSLKQEELEKAKGELAALKTGEWLKLKNDELKKKEEDRKAMQDMVDRLPETAVAMRQAASNDLARLDGEIRDLQAKIATGERAVDDVKKRTDDLEREILNLNLDITMASAQASVKIDEAEKTAREATKAFWDAVRDCKSLELADTVQKWTGWLAEGGRIEDLKSELKEKIRASDSDGVYREAALGFVRTNAAHFSSGVQIEGAPEKALFRLKGDLSWETVPASALEFNLPEDWDGHPLALSLEFKLPIDCDECSQIREVSVSADPLASGIATVKCPDLENGKSKPQFCLKPEDVAPTGAKVEWRYADGAREELKADPRSGMVVVEPHRKVTLKVSLPNSEYEPYDRELEAGHLGASVIEIGKVKLARGLPKLKAVAAAENEPSGPFLVNIAVRRIFVVEDDRGAYADKAVQDAAGRDWPVVHVKKQDRSAVFEFGLETVSKNGQYWVGKVADGAVYQLAGTAGLEFRFLSGNEKGRLMLKADIFKREVGEFAAVEVVRAGTSEDVKASWQSLGRNGREKILEELKRLGDDKDWHDFAAEWYKNHDELHPVISIQADKAYMDAARDGGEAKRVTPLRAVGFGECHPAFGESEEVRFTLWRLCDEKRCRDCAERGVAWTCNIAWDAGSVERVVPNDVLGALKSNPVVSIPEAYANALPDVKFGGEPIAEKGADYGRSYGRWIEKGRTFEIMPHKTTRRAEFSFSRFESVSDDVPPLPRGKTYEIKVKDLKPKQESGIVRFSIDGTARETFSVQIREVGTRVHDSVELGPGKTSVEWRLADWLKKPFGNVEYRIVSDVGEPGPWMTENDIKSGATREVSIKPPAPPPPAPSNGELENLCNFITKQKDYEDSGQVGAQKYFKPNGWTLLPANLKDVIERYFKHVRGDGQCQLDACKRFRLTDRTDDALWEDFVKWCEKNRDGRKLKETAKREIFHDEKGGE